MQNTFIPLDTAPQVLAALLDELRRAVPFVILRNYEGLPDTWGHDVDILIRPGDLQKAQEITLNTFKKNPNAHTTNIMVRLNFWSVSMMCNDRELQIDIYTAISKAWVTYADVENILAASRAMNEYFSVPDPWHELLLIAAKELFSYGYIRPRYHGLLAGHDADESMAEASRLFSGYLTTKGCRLVAEAITRPTVSGRPEICMRQVLNPTALFKWAWYRKNKRRMLY